MKTNRTNLSVMSRGMSLGIAALSLSLLPVGSAIAGSAGTGPVVITPRPPEDGGGNPGTVKSADWDHSGKVTQVDMMDYLADYFAGKPIADMDGNGTVSIFDLFTFMKLWFASAK